MANLRKTTYISTEVELAKIVAFIRAGVKGKEFRIADELVEPLLARLESWAVANRVSLRVAIRSPQGERIVLFGVGGMTAGAIAGFLVTGNPVGALVGAGVGATLGVLASTVDLSLNFGGASDGFVVALPA